MDIKPVNISFRHAKSDDFVLIREWFGRPHVSEYFDDPQTGRSVPDLKKFISGETSFWVHWVGCYEACPFMYLMTSEVCADDDGIWGKWREDEGQTYTLDLFIGNEEFMGHGLAHLCIRKFIHECYPLAAAFLIDPELKNKRALHVYEKAGFKRVESFTPNEGVFAGVPHVMMKLALQDIAQI